MTSTVLRGAGRRYDYGIPTWGRLLTASLTVLVLAGVAPAPPPCDGSAFSMRFDASRGGHGTIVTDAWGVSEVRLANRGGTSHSYFRGPILYDDGPRGWYRIDLRRAYRHLVDTQPLLMAEVALRPPRRTTHVLGYRCLDPATRIRIPAAALRSPLVDHFQ